MRTWGYRWGKTNKQANKHVEIKWLKYVRGLITDANCFRVGGERGSGGEPCTWWRERGTWEYPPCAFGLRLTSELSPLSGEGQHRVQIFTSAGSENTLNTTDYTRRHHSTAKPHTHRLKTTMQPWRFEINVLRQTRLLHSTNPGQTCSINTLLYYILETFCQNKYQKCPKVQPHPPALTRTVPACETVAAALLLSCICKRVYVHV